MEIFNKFLAVDKEGSKRKLLLALFGKNLDRYFEDNTIRYIR